MESSSAPAGHVTRGILLRIVSVVCFALLSALMKIGAERGAGLVELVFYRSLFGLPVVLLWAAAGPGFAVLRAHRPSAHVWRAGLGMSAMFCTFGSLILLPLAEATTIFFTGPIFATLLSWLVLHEKVGRHRMLAALAAFLGVIVVMRPGAAGHAIVPFGVVLALVAALGQASVTVTLRRLGDREHVAAIVFWFLIACSVVGLLLMPLFGRSPDAATVLILACGGLAGGLGQICMTASLQDAPIAALSPFDYLQLVGAILLGWGLLGDAPTLNTWAGATLIAGSGLYTLWRENRLRRQHAVSATQVMG